MRRLLLLATLMLVAPAAASAAPRWGETPPVELGAGEVATCLRDAGGGRVAALAEQDGRFGGALYTVGADGLRADGEVLLGRRVDQCPAVAANASGAAVVAAVVGPSDRGRLAPPRLRVSVRDAGGAFAPPVDLAAPSTSLALIEPAVAVGADGTVLVAWRERWNRYPPGRELLSVRVVRRPVGGRFGVVETLVDRARGGDGDPDGVPPAVGVDAAGSATVAWARTRPARRDRGLASVEVTAAAPGAAFARPQRLDDGLLDVNAVALALGPGGRALLAHDGMRDGGECVRVYERGQGGGAFVPGPVAGGGDLGDAATRPAVALAVDGGAVVAWRAGDSVDAIARAGFGGFGPVQRLQRQDDTAPFGVLVDSSGSPAIDDDDGRLRASADLGGRAAVGWLVEGGAVRGPGSARVAPAAGGVFSPATVVGGPVRDVDGIVPWLGTGGLAAVWSDNRTRASVFTLPVGHGRLRLAQAARPPTSPAAPGVRLAARPQALYGGDPLIVDAHCDAACDLRATIRRSRRDGEAPGVAFGTAVRGGAGHVRLRLDPQFGSPIAPPGGGTVRVLVVAAAPGGVESLRAVVEARVRRRPAPAFRPPLDVRARRAGDAVVVTWRTAGPARRMRFGAYTRRTRGTEPTLESAFASRHGRGDRRFRMRIYDARDARWVVLLATARDRPRRFERVVVPVAG